MSTVISTFASVYGPVQSWRYGTSLGIDPIGAISSCSFDCVYCQLGKIEQQRCDRQIFIATDSIQQQLQGFAPWNVDVITVSGSGEPTLALNLGELLMMAKRLTNKPVGVLTNGSLLTNASVRKELAIAHYVAVKVDAVCEDQFHRVNRPLASINLLETWASLLAFREQYEGRLAIQTMLLNSWRREYQEEYIRLMQKLQPDEIQLNTPTRPCPVAHYLEARENYPLTIASDTAKQLKCVSAAVLHTFSDRIQTATGIPVRYPSIAPQAVVNQSTKPCIPKF